MKDMNQSKYSSDYLIETMMEVVTKKDELSKKYDAAKDIDDLLLIASNRICISAAGIMFSLKGPKRGNLVLRLMKKLRPQSHQAYCDRNNNLYAQCVFLIIFKLSKFIQSNFDFSPTQSFYKNLMAWAGMHFYTINKYNDEDKEQFILDMVNAIIEFENNPPKDENEQLSRIIKAHGKKPKLEDSVDFMKASIIRDPLLKLNPFDFIENYKRINKLF